MMETFKNTIFSFLGPDPFQTFIFEYSLIEQIAITQEPQFLSLSAWKSEMVKWKAYLKGAYQKNAQKWP